MTGRGIVLETSRLSPVDEAILNELKDGARTKGFLVDQTGFHRNTIGTHLRILEAADAVTCLHRPTALYELEENPR